MVLKRLLKLTEYSNRFAVMMQKIVLVFTSLVLVSVMVFETFSRYSLNSPIWGWEELAMISAIWLYMIGATLAAYEGAHLKTDIMSLWVKNRRNLGIIRVLTALISLVMAGFMAYWSSSLLFWGLEQGQTTAVFGIPYVVAQGSLFVAGILISIYFLRDLLRQAGDILRPGDPSSQRLE